MKDMDKQPSQEVHRARNGDGVWSFNALWAHHPLDTPTCSSTQEVLSPVIQGFLWRFHYAGIINY